MGIVGAPQSRADDPAKPGSYPVAVTSPVNPANPLVLIDAAIHDEPLALLAEVAAVVRYANDRELDALVSQRGPEVVGLGTLLSTRVDAALLERMPNLRVVANCAVGIDNVDLDAAARRGIVVTNTPDVLTEATADLTWALILAVARRLREGEALVRSGEWEGWHPRQLLGMELAGSTLAILGLGRIGEAVARRAIGFKMDVVYVSRTPRPDLETRLMLRRFPLEQALERADVATVHLPLTDETRHLIGAAELARMRPGAILVNTARGPIVDEAALAEALERGRIAGAGLDVYEDEPRVHPRLLTHPRTVLLPHLGSATDRTRLAMARRVAENLLAVLAGRPAPTPVEAYK
jgi:glyoxylate reductase